MKTPQQQIDELVEKVAKELFENHYWDSGRAIPWEDEKSGFARERAIKKAKQILFNNNLAIIDYSVKIPETKLAKVWVMWAEIQKDKMVKAGFTHSVVPLKEME